MLRAALQRWFCLAVSCCSAAWRSPPMRDIGGYMSALTAGDYKTAVPIWDRNDEVGEMAKAVAHFREAELTKMRMEEEGRPPREG